MGVWCIASLRCKLSEKCTNKKKGVYWVDKTEKKAFISGR